MPKSNHIICPTCQTEISIDAVLSQQIEADLQAKFAAEKKKLLDQNSQQAAQLSARKTALEQEQKNLLAQKTALEAQKSLQEKQIQEKVAAQLTAQLAAQETKLRQELKTQLTTQLAQENQKELDLLAEQLQEKTKKLDAAQQKELELRKQAIQLEEKQKELELEVQRKIDAQRAQIEEAASKKAAEQEHLKLAELQKQLQDVQKANVELTRKLQQGSQQNQGEVLELELESTLQQAFPTDEVLPVAKGVSGADLIQKVCDRFGNHCGTIVWESKQTKNFTEGWIAKLKDDQRREKAEFAIIVSTALPKEVQNFGTKDGVWVCNFASVLGLAHALRLNLHQLHIAKQAAIGKDQKMEALYQYITGTEFRQKIESIAEAFTQMQADLEKEKTAYQKIWAKREKQISQVISNTYGLYGNLEGLVGKSLPQIKLLELGDGEDDLLEAAELPTAEISASTEENLVPAEKITEESVSNSFASKSPDPATQTLFD